MGSGVSCEDCYYYKFKLVESKTGLPKSVRPVCLAESTVSAQGVLLFPRDVGERCQRYITTEEKSRLRKILSQRSLYTGRIREG